MIIYNTYLPAVDDQSAASRENTSFTVLPKWAAIFKANTVDGMNFPSSMALIVWRLTPIASASCCWEIFTMARSTRMLFCMAQGPPHPEHFYSENGDV